MLLMTAVMTQNVVIIDFDVSPALDQPKSSPLVRAPVIHRLGQNSTHRHHQNKSNFDTDGRKNAATREVVRGLSEFLSDFSVPQANPTQWPVTGAVPVEDRGAGCLASLGWFWAGEAWAVRLWHCGRTTAGAGGAPPALHRWGEFGRARRGGTT